MASHPKCACMICAVEQSLVLDLAQPINTQKYAHFIFQNPVLSGFPTIGELITRLRETTALQNPEAFWDEILRQFLHRNDDTAEELCRNVLFLALVPAVHKLGRQIGLSFPALAREDISQHLFTSLLEILERQNIRRQHSHFAFTIIRSLRRHSYRWATTENQFLSGCEIEPDIADDRLTHRGSGFENGIHLHTFLSECRTRGVLGPTEHELLLCFYIHGFRASVLAAQRGLSEVALRRRIQRLIARLRRIALRGNQTGPNSLRIPYRKPLRDARVSAA